MNFRFKPLVALLGFALLLLTFFSAKAIAYTSESRVHFETSFEILQRDVTEQSTQYLGKNFPEETLSAQSLRLLAKLSVQVVRPLEIYGLAGGSDLKLSIDDFEYNANFGGAYGAGARVVLYREDNSRNPFEVFADYRFLNFKTQDKIQFTPTDLDGSLLADEIVSEKIRWTEHAIKFGVLGRHDEFEPYGGVRFSFVRGKDFIAAQVPLHARFRQTDTFGVFAGTTYFLTPTEKAALFVEGSLFDQYSLTGGFRVGF